MSWIIFIGLCIKAGALIINLILSLFKPEIVPKPLDLTELYKDNKWTFFQVYSLALSISMVKAYLFYLVVRLILKIDLSRPFNKYTSEQISKISYYTLSIGLMSYIAKRFVENSMHQISVPETLTQFWGDSQAFVLMGAVLYIIATIFKKGVALQHENDLTV